MLALAPSEILDHIFSELSPVDLTNVRLVCRSFSLLAARQLFCEVFVWPNRQSLQNLHHIASHPYFRQYVRTMAYSQAALPVYSSYPEWLDQLHSYSRYREHPGGYHEAYEFEIEYQKILRANGTLKSILTRALALMPNLTNILLSNPWCNAEGRDKASMLRVARGTLITPVFDEVSPWQATNLFESLYDSGRQIKLLKGSGLSLAVFAKPSARLDIFGPQLRHLHLHCRHYTRSLPYGIAKLAQILKQTRALETLELGIVLMYSTRRMVFFFRQFWPTAVHYHSLNRLSLSKIRVPQTDLTDFLTLHAPTLRSLELRDVEFELKKVRGEICADSWVGMIHFLQRHMNLTNVNLASWLSNGGDEIWCSSFRHFPEDSDLDDSMSEKSLECPIENTLKYRIEKFIVEGGECPLDIPHEREHEDPEIYWTEIGDETWYLSEYRFPFD